MLALAATLGYNRTVTLLLCAPPWFFATIVAFLLARSSDKRNERAFHIIASILLANVGFIISLATQNTAARFVALCVTPLLLENGSADTLPQILAMPMLRCIRVPSRLAFDKFPTAACKARRRPRSHQRVQSTRQRRWLVCLAETLGTHIPQLLWHCKC